MQTISRSTFPTVKTEGGLLPADLLQRIAEGNAPGMRAEEYHLVGERLNEAITRAWNRCLGAWRKFDEKRQNLSASDTGTSLTRDQWLQTLFQTLDYGRLPNQRSIEIDGVSYPISHLWDQTPIHLVTFRQELDKRSEVATTVKRTPHSLLQELLNRSPAYQWGIVSNGLRLRILRDNATLSRSAFVEFDLEALMSGERYADFALLWLVCHQSRFERLDKETGGQENGEIGSGGEEEESAGQSPTLSISNLRTCWLETWSKSAAEQGTRVMAGLRQGVQEAIEGLGNGFLQHPANETLRQALHRGELTTQGYYQQLRRLVYRLIFLFVAEDRNLLLLPGSDLATQQRYNDYYGLSQLRQLAETSRGTAHPDLYRRVRLLFELLRNGYPALGLPGLGSYLFSAAATPALDGADLANRELLTALRALIFTSENSVRRAVDYRNLDSEELGSIYESLLDLHPQLAGSHFSLQGSSTGSERKTTGSHYTPTSLVNCLLDSALEPVVAERLAKASEKDRKTGRQEDKEKSNTPKLSLSSPLLVSLSGEEQAILSIKVLDPACGSGHMLIGAARRLARHLARIRTGDEEPAPEALRTALREVVRHCIYGVDLNETAVELCKVALWMETLEPGKPLSFLDSHIRCGNSLIGVFNLEDLEEGIPDEAFVALSGDDKGSASRIKKRNSQERKQKQQLSLLGALDEGDLVSGFRSLSSQPEETAAEVAAKAQRYATLRQEEHSRHEQMACHLWSAAFFAQFSGNPKTDERIATTADLRQFLANPHSLDAAKLDYARQRAEHHAFFHWCLEFPDVWARGGFDMLISNPPWERVKLQEKEWFAARSPQITAAPNAAARKAMIERLKEDDPALFAAFAGDVHAAESESHFIRNSGRSPLCGRGDVNTYAVFAELANQLIREAGRAGIIVPSGIATDDTTKFFFQEIMESQTLVSLYSFENEEFIFPSVHHAFKFCLLTLAGQRATNAEADFVFFARQVEALKDEQRHFSLSDSDIRLLNPNTRTCPSFRSKRDANLAKAIYQRVPILVDETTQKNLWELRIRRVFDINKSDVLAACRRNGDELREEYYVKMYEAKMIYQFDHRFGTYKGQTQAQANQGKLPELTSEDHQNPNFEISPKYWLPSSTLLRQIKEHWQRQWLLTWRDIASSANTRTMISAITPLVATDFTLRVGFFMLENISSTLLLLSNLNSFVLDYCVRQMIGGNHLSDYVVKQVPVIPQCEYDKAGLQDKSRFVVDINSWVCIRALELTYTAWDLQPFAQDLLAELQQLDPTSPLATRHSPLAPYCWNEERRFLLRCELDAAYFHLYGIARDDVAYILDTFPIVKRKEIAEHGEYRTQRVILEIYDALAEAMSTGVAYQTRLDPPPGDVRMCHATTATPPQPSPNEGGGRDEAC